MSKKKALFIKVFEEQLTRIFNKWGLLGRKPRDYETGDILYPSEIHVIASIAENPNTYMAEIANILGVTRGAIMQLVLKLEKKELVERYTKGKNSKKVFLKLTSKGIKAASGHEKYHKNMYQDLSLLLKKYKISDLELFEQVFNSLETHFDSYLVKKK